MGLLRQAAACRTGNAVAAAAGPAPVRENSILLIGGDKPRQLAGPGPGLVAQSRDILVYDVIGNTWTRQGEWPVGIATVPAVVRGSEIMTISGETAPGVRNSRKTPPPPQVTTLK